MEQPSVDIGSLIREARERKGMRQQDVADALGVSQQAVQSWEAGKSSPRGILARNKLAALLGIDPGVLPSGATVTNFVFERTRLPTAADVIKQAESLFSSVAPAAETPVPEFVLVSKKPDEVTKHRFTRRFEQRDEMIKALADALPPDLRRHVRAEIDSRGFKYRFHYLSRKVVLSIVGPTSHMADIPVYLAMHRLSVMVQHFSDNQIRGRHYSIAFLYDPEFGEAALPPRALAEAKTLDFALNVFKTPADIAAHIVELESTMTDLDSFYESSGWADIEDVPYEDNDDLPL